MSTSVRFLAAAAAPALGASLVLASAAPALAAYPPVTPKCTVSPTSLRPGASATIVGVSFTAGSTVRASVNAGATLSRTSGTANPSGSVSFPVKAASAGTSTVTLSSGTQSATCSVRVLPAVAPTSVAPTSAAPTTSTPPNPTVLVRTGSSPWGPLSFGGGLLAVGVGALVVARRRTA